MRFRAPRGNRDVLAEPGFPTLPGLVEANRWVLNRSDMQVGGLPLRELRLLARREAIEAAHAYLPSRRSTRPDADRSASSPLVLAGHQPELSHTGVWIKNFALAGLAQRVGGVSLNLVVDNDTLKSTSLRVPTWDTSPLQVHLQSVPYDTFTNEAPYESREVRDPGLFASFAERVLPLTRNWGYEPLLGRAWRAGPSN